MQKILLMLLLLFGNLTFAQPCPKSGNSTTPEKKKINVLKNAGVNVNSSLTPEFLPLKNLLPSKKRKDRKLYADGAYVTTEGYLISLEEEGPEACNCGKAKASLKNGDVHMYLGLKKNAKKIDCIVVEITPAFKKKHPDYGTMLGENIKVSISGYLLYDFIHEPQAINTCTSCSDAWRRTCWEIHPVTAIELIND
jgi:hypothetical protein